MDEEGTGGEDGPCYVGDLVEFWHCFGFFFLEIYTSCCNCTFEYMCVCVCLCVCACICAFLKYSISNLFICLFSFSFLSAFPSAIVSVV